MAKNIKFFGFNLEVNENHKEWVENHFNNFNGREYDIDGVFYLEKIPLDEVKETIDNIKAMQAQKFISNGFVDAFTKLAEFLLLAYNQGKEVYTYNELGKSDPLFFFFD